MRYLSLVSLVLLVACQTTVREHRFRDRTLPIDARVDDLMSRMTLEEKVAQICCVWPMAGDKEKWGKGILDKKGRFNPEGARKLLHLGIGQVARPTEAKTLEEGVAYFNAIQRFLVEETRLGIPAMFHEEGLHGHMAPGGTCFPQAIALSCTWDEDLIERIFGATAKEMRVRGAHHALTPVLDVCRDPRWGRTEETYGEDTWLVSRLGVACIRGFQGRGARPDQMLPPDRVFATAKHFAVHGQPEGGTNCAPANYSERQIRQVFLPPFEAAVREAGVSSVMASYNEVDGIPLHAHQKLMVDTLRRDWGFEGFVVSDYLGIDQLKTLHHVVDNFDDAGQKALAAQVDIELPWAKGYKNLATLVREGKVPEAWVDRAARRILRAKFACGVMDRPYPDLDRARRIVNSKEHQDLALEAARKAIVLLKNEGNVLPLDEKKLESIAVIGPNAAPRLLGGYTDPDGPGRVVTMLEGIQERAAKTGHTQVFHAEGCRITPKDADWWKDKVELSPPEEDTDRIAEALKVAGKADVTVMFLGGNEATCREAWATYHLGDRDSLDLLGRQQELFDKVHALGKPLVVVLLGGRPLTINKIADEADAILQGWYLGQEGGTALAEVLFGDTNPSGKLTISFPRSVGQIPAHYSQKPSARRGYLLADNTPLYPFGLGLSYTTFEYQKPTLERETIQVGESAVVSVTVRNTGKVAGTEIVQCYIRDKVSTVTRPTLELRGFERVHLKAGEERRVQFVLTPRHLAGLSLDNTWVVEPGEFEISTGPSSAELASTKLVVR